MLTPVYVNITFIWGDWRCPSRWPCLQLSPLHRAMERLRGRHLQQNSGCIQPNISSYLDIVNFPSVYINPAKEVNDLSKAKQALLHESNNLILKTILQKRHTAILLVRTGTGVTSAYSFTSPLQTYGLGVPPIWLHKLRTKFEKRHSCHNPRAHCKYVIQMGAFNAQFPHLHFWFDEGPIHFLCN